MPGVNFAGMVTKKSSSLSKLPMERTASGTGQPADL